LLGILSRNFSWLDDMSAWTVSRRFSLTSLILRPILVFQTGEVGVEDHDVPLSAGQVTGGLVGGAERSFGLIRHASDGPADILSLVAIDSEETDRGQQRDPRNPETMRFIDTSRETNGLPVSITGAKIGRLRARWSACANRKDQTVMKARAPFGQSSSSLNVYG
jgi:hypothetical protein